MKLLIVGIFILATSRAHVVHQPNSKKVAASGPCYTTTFDQYNYLGYYHTFIDNVQDLSHYNYSNRICSVQQTGLWMYYQNKNYNKLLSGQIYWVHGIDFSINFPINMCGVTNSLKFGGNRYSWNEDSYTLYEGEYFTGAEFYGITNSAGLSILNTAGSSLVLTGRSSWTFYTGLSFNGSAYCFYPTTDEDVGINGSMLNFGIYPSLVSLGAPDNAFSSVKKGCFSSTVVRGEPMKAVERTKNGAWGIIEL